MKEIKLALMNVPSGQYGLRNLMETLKLEMPLLKCGILLRQLHSHLVGGREFSIKECCGVMQYSLV